MVMIINLNNGLERKVRPFARTEAVEGCYGYDLDMGELGKRFSFKQKMDGKSLADRIPMASKMEASGGTNIKGMEGLGNLPINFEGNLVSATTDKELSDLLSQAKSSKRPVVVNYGATWCHACRQMLPTFCNASNEYPKALFIYADIDKCEQETQDVRYTPTFRFYRDGEKVDEFYGAGPQRLRDRLWLHS